MSITRCGPGVAVVLLLAGCGDATPQDEGGRRSQAQVAAAADVAPMTDEQGAAAALAAMLELAEAGDWGAYVDRYYGEAHKFGGPDDRDALVWRFEQRWGPRVVEALRQASSLTPTVGDDGRAIFSRDGQVVFVLHEHADGRWTFHL